MFLFLAIIIKMGHNTHGSLNDYWLNAEQFSSPFCGKTLKRERFLHIFKFLHFSSNDKALDNNDLNYISLWKKTYIFNLLNAAQNTVHLLSTWLQRK
jgi:hypothetical protein